jgi:hypothetical protein
VILLSLCKRNARIVFEPLQIYTHNCVDQYRNTERNENIGKEKKNEDQEKDSRERRK